MKKFTNNILKQFALLFVIGAAFTSADAKTLRTDSTCNLSPDFTYTFTGTTVTFTGTANGGRSYKWRFGEGSESNLQNPVFNYLGKGTYMVWFIVYDSLYGCSDSILKPVTTCIADAKFSYTVTGRTVSFTNLSTLQQFNNWDFGDGNYSRDTNPVHRFTDNGTYTVCLFTDETGGCSGKRYCVDIVIDSGSCHAYFTIEKDTTGMYSAIIKENSILSGTRTYYFWDFGDGDTSHSKNPSHIYPSGAGEYTLCLTIEDSACLSQYCDTLKFDSLGNLNATLAPFSVKVVNSNSSTLGIDDINTVSNIKVFPNPSNGIVRIASEGIIQSMIISDLQGKVLLHQTVNADNASTDISSFAEGLYLIRIKSQNGRITTVKLVKQ